MKCNLDLESCGKTDWQSLRSQRLLGQPTLYKEDPNQQWGLTTNNICSFRTNLLMCNLSSHWTGQYHLFGEVPTNQESEDTLSTLRQTLWISLSLKVTRSLTSTEPSFSRSSLRIQCSQNLWRETKACTQRGTVHITQSESLKEG